MSNYIEKRRGYVSWKREEKVYMEKVYIKRAEKKIEGKEKEREGESNELGLRNDDSPPRHRLITGVDITKGYADHEFVIGSL